MAALPANTEVVISDIAATYRSDGQTYGTGPGDFGRVTHMQLFIAEPLPAPESAPTTLPESGGIRGNLTGVWLAVLAGALLVGIGWRLRKKVA